MATRYQGSAVQRARAAQAELREQCERITQDLQRAVLTPNQGRYPHRLRNQLTDEAMRELEAKHLEIERLERLIPEFVSNDEAGHAALDVYGSRDVPDHSPQARRFARELNAPTSPFATGYVQDPAFDQKFKKVRDTVEQFLDQQEQEGRKAGGVKRQQEVAADEYYERYLTPQEGDRWDTGDAYKNRQALEMLLGGTLPAGMRPTDADPGYDGRTTGDPEMDALLREQLPKGEGSE